MFIVPNTSQKWNTHTYFQNRICHFIFRCKYVWFWSLYSKEISTHSLAGVMYSDPKLIQKWTGCSGLQPGCQWSNFSWPGIWFPSVGWIKPVASPELFRDFWVVIWCTFSQTGLFQDVPLPQPGNLRESWKFVWCTCSQLGLFLDVPLLQPGMLREALYFIRYIWSQPGLFRDCSLPWLGIIITNLFGYLFPYRSFLWFFPTPAQNNHREFLWCSCSPPRVFRDVPLPYPGTLAVL